MTVSIERVDGRRRLVVSRVLGAPRETVWELLTDTERWPEWGPSVRAVEATDRYIRAGTTGRIETPVGVSVPFEVTDCREFRWEWDVARLPATGHRVERVGEDRSRVAFELSPLLAGYVPVCKRALDRIEAVVSSGRR